MQVAERSSGIGGGAAAAAAEMETSLQDELPADIETVYETVRKIVAGNAVVVFAVSGCCMCHVVKQLLFGLGVAPTVVELDRRDKAGREIHSLLYHLAGHGGGGQPIPAIFVGGKFLGGVETLMACHINGTLVPLLKDAGALWL